MFVAPGRETFFAFPSEILGNKYTLTVFLPTQIAPISQHYPVVYFVGLDRSDREAFQRFAQQHKVFLVGLSIPEEDFLALDEKLAQFVEQELIPYIDTNYATVAYPSGRVLAAMGEKVTKAVLPLANKEYFGALSLQSPGKAINKMGETLPKRVFIMGSQEELAAASAILESAGAVYGSQYAFEYAPFETDWLKGLNLTYLFASPEEVKVKKLNLKTGVKSLSVQAGKSLSLQVYATLANGLKTVLVPSFVRTSPPYLDWQPSLGMLRVRSGAEPGSIKLTVHVDNVENTTEILLKKQ